MKRWEEISSIGAFMLFVMLCVLAGFGGAAISGTSTGVSSLGVFGPYATFTCEWKSEDGQQAIFTSSSGSRRFVDLKHQQAGIVVGTRYRVKSHWVHKWATKTYLEPV